MEVSSTRTCEIILLHTLEPWNPLGKAKIGGQEWYFFSPKDRKYPTTGVRADRATASGYWKATGKDKENICSNRKLEEMKKTPVSYMDRAPIEHPAGLQVSIVDIRSMIHAVHCSVGAPKPSVRFPTSDTLHNIEIKHEADINGSIKIFAEAEIESAARYLRTLIGEGDFGKVYMGLLDPRNAPVAVKKYINEDWREVFVEEVRIHSKFSHKNVVKALGYCNGEHTLMSVMEYMPKGNLNDILHHSEIPIPLDVRLGIAIGCAAALSYMHSMHLPFGNLVCHGDIKPANILLDDNLTAKLTDFGVSRLLAGGITRYTKTVKGSIEYMDPICIHEGCLTPRGDVYSFGLILCEIIARKRVRKGDMDPIYTQEGCPTRMEIARDVASALVFLHSSLGRYSIVNRDLKPDNILLDQKVEPKISDFGLSRVHHADDHTHIPMGRAVQTHNRWLYAKFSGKPSAKRGIETSIGSHVSRRPRCLSVHHHPLMQILPSARKWITSKRTFGNIFKAWISAKPTYETPNINAGPVSEYIIRKLFGIWNGLTVNESQQHSDPEYSRQDHGKKAVNTKTSASWTIATAAPHHAGDMDPIYIQAEPVIIAGPVSEYIIRKLFGICNELTVNESQQHSEPDSCRSDHGKMARNTKTSASWIIATAAPHHATGNRSLLSGFVTEHDDRFVHAVNRVPMKVLARGAVVTDTLILPDVWFVPGLTENLVSVSQLAELDHSIGFGRGECCIRSARNAKIVGKGRLQKGGHYVLDYLKVPLAI